MESIELLKDRRAQAWTPTRKSLLHRLKNWDDHESWSVFVETYSQLIYLAVRRAGLGDDEAREITQETIISVCKSLKNFSYDSKKGSFKSWLLKVTQRRIVDFRRAQARQRRGIISEDGEGAGQIIDKIADSATKSIEEIWEAEWEQNLWEAALRKLKEKCKLDQYQIFDLHVLQGWKVSEVARLTDVTTAYVYVVKHRLGRALKKEYEALRAKPL
jgi:RNA polymerase sigma-70 factor (ECF subfamily)